MGLLLIVTLALVPQAVLPHRQRAEAVNRILEDRIESLLPPLMREAGLDCWLVINREYAEDPVYLTLVPEPVFAARRTTMLAFFENGERVTVSRYPIGRLYKSVWKGGSDDDQWARLAQLLREKNPKKIGVNVSRDWAFGDGLSGGLRDRLTEALGPLANRLVSAESLCVRWIETRTPLELEVYPHIVAIARSIIAEAFSDKVITPGVTTTDDLRWWIRQRYATLGLDTWFMPDVNVQRKGLGPEDGSAFLGRSGEVIRRGDVLHTDMGITYLRLNTDTQEMGYVLRSGETDVPEGLRRALATGNRWQDLLTSEFRTGRTGNEILAATRMKAEMVKIDCSVYSHPLGFFGHAAGPTIGMWDNQGPTPVRGDWKLAPNTCYAIEGNVSVAVPEWDGQAVQIKLEQSALFDGEKIVYLAGRQTEWHVVK